MTKATKATATNPSREAQSDRFQQVARELNCGEDETHWDERLRKIAKQKPVEKPEKAVRP